MVNQLLTQLDDTHSMKSARVHMVFGGKEMNKPGSKDTNQRYESVHDFVRRALAEARLIIAEIESSQIEIEGAAPGTASVRFTSQNRHS